MVHRQKIKNIECGQYLYFKLYLSVECAIAVFLETPPHSQI